MTAIPVTPAKRHKKTFMIDGITRSKLESLSMMLDTHQTDVFRRAVSLMHVLNAEGREIYLISDDGLSAKLDLPDSDSAEDERKMTLMFNDETLGKVNDLSAAFRIYPTYVFRRSVAILSAVHRESINGQKIVLVNSVNGESETLRFF